MTQAQAEAVLTAINGVCKRFGVSIAALENGIYIIEVPPTHEGGIGSAVYPTETGDWEIR